MENINKNNKVVYLIKKHSSLTVYQKLNDKVTVTHKSTPWYIPKRIENYILTQKLVMFIAAFVIHNSQKLKTTQCPSLMNGLSVVYPYSGMLFGSEKE